jgi:arylformamidase
VAAGWIDISVPLRNGMAVWPGDPPTRIERIAAIERGDEENISAMSLCLHAGTHIDAPLHYFEHGAAIDTMPPEALIGPARVMGMGADLAGQKIRRGERILFKSHNAVLTEEAAGFLAQRRVLAVGIDGMSIGPPSVHKVLLGAGVWIIENLDLSAIEPGRYDLVCLPLSIHASDGAPARAIVRPRFRWKGSSTSPR